MGGILILTGFCGSVLAFLHWKQLNFGPLDPAQTFRLVVPSLLLAALGAQVIFSSFFLAVLRLEGKHS